jgi:flagellar export protein FliJ
MKSFRFPLEKALSWRRTQLEVEQTEFRKRSAAVAAIDQERSEMKAAGVAAEVQVRESRTIEGRDLEALARFRDWIRQREKQLIEAKVVRERALGEQRTVMLEARRRTKLLERLKERRLAEWNEASTRELESFAADAFLAKWPSRQAASNR